MPKVRRGNLTETSDCPTEFKRRKTQSENDDQNLINHASVMLLNASCVRYKKDPFITKDFHLVHFISEDCKFTTQVSKDLEGEGLVNFEALLTTQPKKGHVVVFEQNERYIFHLVSRSTYDERPSLEIFKQCLVGLKRAMEELNVDSCNFSRRGNGLDRLSWSGIEGALRDTFDGSGITIHICTNELLVPGLEDRQRIIEECHSSVSGGHLRIGKHTRD